MPFPGSNSPLTALVLARKPGFKTQTVLPHPPSASASIPAGVYKTAPYSCIVVVPGPHPDDRCVIKPNGGDFPMPVIKPDIRFIPRDLAKE